MSDTTPRKGPQGTAKKAEADQTAADQAAAEQAEAEQAAVQPAETKEKPDLDEVKRKFRAALDRKREASTDDGAGDSGRDARRIPGGRGPAASRRSFRRKSG